MKTILFILKQNLLDYRDCEAGYSLLKSSGLFNSARMVCNTLNSLPYHEFGEPCPGELWECFLELAVDGNDIDRIVTKYKPAAFRVDEDEDEVWVDALEVVLEAIWVTPDKLEELQKLHPDVLWTVRIHSELPFLAQEGVAIDWLVKYLTLPNIRVGFNSLRCKEGFEKIHKTKHHQSVYMPNLYYQDDVPTAPSNLERKEGELHIGCFGAVRPFKNMVNQSLAALDYADRHGKKLVFHINGSRTEDGGNAILKSIRAIFSEQLRVERGHQLVEHLWLDHPSFKNLLKAMDLVIQVSYTETFNIVAADAVMSGTPVVTSTEVPWVSKLWCADPNSIKDISSKIARALTFRGMNVWMGKRELSYKPFTYSARALAAWKKLL